MNKAELLSQIQAGWDNVDTFLSTLSDAQITQPTDAAGWTVKDHVIHMAVWEDGLTGFLDKQDRRAYMGIDEAIWKPDNDDPINDVIYQRNKDLSWAEVQQKRQEVHTKLLKQIEAMSDETLQGAYGVFNPNSQSERPITNYISGATILHYADHIPWMAAIVEGDS